MCECSKPDFKSWFCCTLVCALRPVSTAVVCDFSTHTGKHRVSTSGARFHRSCLYLLFMCPPYGYLCDWHSGWQFLTSDKKVSLEPEC